MSPLHYFFYGLAFFQLVYISYNAFLFRRPELIRYFLFCLMMTVYVLSIDVIPVSSLDFPLFGSRTTLWRVILIINSGAVYFSFIRYLINAAEKHVTLNRILIGFERFVPVFSVLLLLTAWIFDDIALLNYALTTFYFLILPVQLYAVYVMFIHRTLYTGLVIAGTILLMVFLRIGFTSPLLSWFAGTVQLGFPFFLTGLILNFCFINLSLIFKSKEVQDEKLRLEIRKHDELNRQREMISNDLHDDTGATLSSLYLYSSMAENVIEKDSSAARGHLRRISIGLREVMEKMNDIIWAVRRDEFSEKRLSSRIKDYYYDLMDAAGITCTYDVDLALESCFTNINIRRNLLLIAKEAINNAIKHSGASHIIFSLQVSGSVAVMKIADNGSGFDPAKAGSGHGMTSISHRAAEMGGTFLVDTESGRGTVLTVRIPIERISD